MTGRNGVPASRGDGGGDVTATGPTASSQVIVYSSGTALPVASNLNFTRGQNIPNLVIVSVGASHGA